MSTTNTPQKRKLQDEFSVPNWTEASSIELRACSPHGCVPALINLSAHRESLSFHHSITPHQARIMAAQLMILADTTEEFEFHSVADLMTVLKPEQVVA